MAGRYAYDLANRFEYTDIPKDKIKLVYNTQDLGAELSQGSGDIIVITCFSDRDKLLSQVETLPPEDCKLPF